MNIERWDTKNKGIVITSYPGSLNRVFCIVVKYAINEMDIINPTRKE